MRSSNEQIGKLEQWRKVLLVIVTLVAIYLGLPQPKVDWDAVTNLAAKHVDYSSTTTPHTNNNNNNQQQLPLEGTTIVITGATSGVGRGLAETLYRMGGTIVAIGRSSSKLDRLKQDLEEGQTENDYDASTTATTSSSTQQSRRLIPITANFNDLESISNAANEIGNRFQTLDFLINNAGMHYSGNMFDFTGVQQSTVQGHDLVFGVNYLSHFLLTEKLIPILERSNKRPRIIQISSSFHWSVDGTDLKPGEDGSTAPYASRTDVTSFMHKQRSYSNSKLAQILHMRSLARDLDGQDSSIKVITVCPGWVGTSIGGKSNEFALRLLAFPYDGFGLSSILDAMFRLDVGDGVGVGRRRNDFFLNNRVLAFLPQWLFVRSGLFQIRWISTSGIRDLVTWTFGLLALHIQKLTPGEFVVDSSPESYDTKLQDSLYEWSKNAVDPWM